MWKSAAMREWEWEKGGFRDGVGVWSGDGGGMMMRGVLRRSCCIIWRGSMRRIRSRWPSSTGCIRSISAYQGQKQQTLSDLRILASHFPNQHIRTNMNTPFTTFTPQF